MVKKLIDVCMHITEKPFMPSAAERKLMFSDYLKLNTDYWDNKCEHDAT